MSEINIINRKARHEYFVEESFTAGMVLTGSEVKSIRTGNVNMTEAYGVLISSELWIKNMHVSEWKQGGNYFNHLPLRDRKVLLSKKELRKLAKGMEMPGYAIIPLRIFESERGYLKMEIGLCKGKKSYDKREDLKKKDAERDIKKFV